MAGDDKTFVVRDLTQEKNDCMFHAVNHAVECLLGLGYRQLSRKTLCEEWSPLMTDIVPDIVVPKKVHFEEVSRAASDDDDVSDGPSDTGDLDDETFVDNDLLSAKNVKQAVRQVFATWTHEKFQTQKVKKNFENDEVMKYLKVPVLYQHTKSII